MEIVVSFNCLENQQRLQVQCRADEKLESIINQFSKKAFADPKDFIYYYEGKEINKDSTLAKLINNRNQQFIDITIKRRTKIFKCSKCTSNNAVIKIEGYRLKFFGCCNNHDDLRRFEEYEDSQRINFGNIKCDNNKCGKTQKNTLEDFYKCLKCSNLNGYAIYYCNTCNQSHKHKTIKYDEKYYYCTEHYNEYISYCSSCKQNLCETCEKKHLNLKHLVKRFDSMIPNIKDLKKKLEKLYENIDDLKYIVETIKNKMDNAVKIIENYYFIAQDFINKYETFNSKLKNYQTLKTINYLYESNKEINKDIDRIIQGNSSAEDWQKKCKILIGIIESDRNDYKNEVSSTYENDEQNNIIVNNRDVFIYNEINDGNNNNAVNKGIILNKEGSIKTKKRLIGNKSNLGSK